MLADTRRSLLPFLPFLLAGCNDGGSKGDDTGETVPPSIGGDAEELAENCGSAIPTARRFPQMASFFTETPISSPTGDRTIQRGFLLYGGLDASSSFESPTALSDLWLYDLTARERTDVCRWYQIGGAGGDPLFGGSMVYLEGSQQFVMVGGFEDVGDVRASTKARTFSLTSLSSGYTESTLLGDLDYTISEKGTDECGQMQDITCIDSDTCAVKDVSEAFDPCAPPAASSVWHDSTCMGLDPGSMWTVCETDPWCETGVEGVPFTVSAPGLALSGAAFDPVSGVLTLHGGVTGCLGTCAEWDDLFDADLSGAQALLGANAEFRYAIDFSASSWAAGELATDMSAYAHADWPSQATVGLHGLAAAATGQEWSLSARDWTHGAVDTTTVIAGGTSFQNVAPSTEDAADCTEFNTCGGCSEFGATTTVTGDEVCADDEACVVSSSNAIAEYGGSTTYASIGSSVPGVVYPALLPLPDDRVALVGGKRSGETGGRTAVLVVDVPTGGTEDGFDMASARWGAGAVYDPVGRRGYVFGGHDSSRAVTELEFDDAAEVNLGDYTVSSYRASLEFTGSAWTTGATWTQTYECGSSTCYSDTIWIHVPTDSSSALASVSVSVTYEDASGTPRTVVPTRTNTEVVFSGNDHRMLTYALPVVVADGESLDVTVSYTPVPLSDSDIYSVADEEKWGLRSFSYGPAATPSTGYSMNALPAWPGLGTTPADSAEMMLSVVEYAFDVPGTYTVVAPGTPDTETPTGSVSYAGYQAFWPKSHPIVLLEDVSRVSSAGTPYSVSVDGGAATIRAYVDDSLGASALQEVEDYVMGGGTTLPYTLADDADFIVERLGGPPTSTMNLVYLRMNESVPRSSVGIQVRGTAFVTEFTYAGVINSAEDMATTTLHELAHWWFGEHLRFDDATTYWLQEAVPVALELERYPGANEGRIDDGVEAIITSHSGGSSSAIAPESIGGTDERRYTVGPYVLSQLYWIAHAKARDFWAGIASLTSVSYGHVPTVAEVSPALNALASANYYTQWIATGRTGTPMLGLTELTYVGTDPGSGTWEGQPVYGFTVRQMQVEMKGWDAFDDVPFTIACDLDDHAGIRPFAECGGIQSNLVSPTPAYTMDGNLAVSGTLTGTADLGTTYEPTPLLIALYRGENLLPGPEYGNENGWTWLFTCGPGDTAADCAADLDGDGAPSRGDCDEDTGDGDLVYPFQLPAGEDPVDGTGTDYNCDEWSLN